MIAADIALRVSVVLVFALGLAALLRRRSAALRHWVLAAGIAGAAIAPAASAIVPAWRLPFAPRAAAASFGGDAASPALAGPPTVTIAVTVPPPSTAPRRTPRPSLGTIALAIWAAGAVLGIVALAAALGRLLWIGSRAEPLAEAAWVESRDAVAAELGVRRRVALLQSDFPLLVTWGAVSPKILVPRSAVAWPAERIRIVVAHELAHVARADWPIQIAAEIVRAAHWFNPLAWFVCGRLRLESEHACDDTVLRLGTDGTDYASHLLELARSMQIGRAWVPAEAIFRPSSFERRVTAMLNRRLDRSPLSRASRLAAGAALAAVTLLVAGYSSAQGLTILSGAITDQFGAPLANAPVVLTDPTTGAKHEVTADRSGRYQFVALPSGGYTLSLSVPGFKNVQEPIVLSGDTLRHDVTPKIGTVQETISVASVAVASPPRPSLTPEQLEQRRQARLARIANACGGEGGCLVPPIKLVDKKPVYPAGYAGPGEVVTLRTTIDTSGRVSDVAVVGNATPDLAQAAIAAVRQWEFEPTRLDGQVVDTEMTVTVSFRPPQ